MNPVEDQPVVQANLLAGLATTLKSMKCFLVLGKAAMSPENLYRPTVYMAFLCTRRAMYYA